MDYISIACISLTISVGCILFSVISRRLDLLEKVAVDQKPNCDKRSQDDIRLMRNYVDNSFNCVQTKQTTLSQLVDVIKTRIDKMESVRVAARKPKPKA